MPTTFAPFYSGHMHEDTREAKLTHKKTNVTMKVEWNALGQRRRIVPAEGGCTRRGLGGLGLLPSIQLETSFAILYAIVWKHTPRTEATLLINNVVE